MESLKLFFDLRKSLPQKLNTIILFVGLAVLLLLWQAVTSFFSIPKAILPSPLAVLASFPDLHFKDELVRNALYSLKLNLLGYFEACLIAIPLGMCIGLIPIVRALFSRYIEALRFLPLAATTGLFIVWFGLGDTMKVQFLAVSIVVYLLPIVIQRVDEIPEVYEQTAYTLGAKWWQMVTTVYWPSISSKIIDDCRVIVAVSWTYITIAEMLNMSGGIGALAYKAARQGRTDKIFAVLLVIMVIGVIQDRLFRFLDKRYSPYKYI